MTRTERQTSWWIALALFALAVAGLAWAPRSVAKPTARQLREQLLKELRPVALQNCTLQRYGSRNDGGYLMCGNLLGQIQSAYSYGIGPADDWGCEVSTRHAVPVHQYDCFDPGRPKCPSGQSSFHDECIGSAPSVEQARVFDTLTRQIAKNGDTGKKLVVKIDVEGAELGSLMATPDRVLNRVEQMAMEIHGTGEEYLALVKKLKRTFHVAHLHFNNQACAPKYRPLPAWAYQVLLINKRLARPDRAAAVPTLPHPLDMPDLNGAPDCQLQNP
jgi:hypothetical protein